MTIPAGATTATFSFDFGLKNELGGNNVNNAAVVGIYATTGIPVFAQAVVVGGGSGKINYAPGSNDVTLHHQASASFNISSKAGQTVRFAIINAANQTGHENIGIDNIQFLVNTAALDVPTLSGVSLVVLGLPVGGLGIQLLRREPA